MRRILSTLSSRRSVGERAFLHGFKKAVVGAVEVGGDDDHVVAGLNGGDGFRAETSAMACRENARESAHIERVCDDQAFEAKLVFQQIR
jgi:hypothetical protein